MTVTHQGASRSSSSFNSFMKSVSLLTLTGHNALEAIVIRHSRIRMPENLLYINSTATAVGEVMKMIMSVLLLAQEERSLVSAVRTITTSVQASFVETAKVALVSLVYVIQNNLLFVAASHLDVATYQASYQLKILSTAIFSVVLLRKQLTPVQWVSLCMLLSGVIMVKLAEIQATQGMIQNMPKQVPLIGFGAVVIASAMSGFAGVYLEKVVKTTAASVWLRNVQLSFLSIPLALLACFSYDGSNIWEKGFLFGYDPFVWFAVVVKASGGLIIATVIKYADNILKGFALSIALIILCVVNVTWFQVALNSQFAAGTLMVVLAVFLYNWNPSITQLASIGPHTRKGISYVALEQN